MPLLIYDTREIHKNHVRCGHAGAVPDPKAQHQLAGRGYTDYRAGRLYAREVYLIAGRDERQRDPASTSRRDL